MPRAMHKSIIQHKPNCGYNFVVPTSHDGNGNCTYVEYYMVRVKIERIHKDTITINDKQARKA